MVFPGAPLSRFYAKGEIKPRYYNPESFFDEVHFAVFADEDVKPKKVRGLVGDADIFIHPVGPKKIFSLPRLLRKVEDLAREVRPDVLRAFDPVWAGYFCVRTASRIGAKSVVSLHGDYDRDLRHYAFKFGDYRALPNLLFTERAIEPYVLGNADAVVYVYKFIERYAKKFNPKRAELIYNRAYVGGRKFEPRFPKRVKGIFVGREIREKNQIALVKAFERLPDSLKAELLLIGNGSEFDAVHSYVEVNSLPVKMVKSVLHDGIAKHYEEANVFLSANLYGGIEIPTMEAMTHSLPVVKGYPPLDDDLDFLKGNALLVKNEPTGFASAVTRLFSSREKYLRYARSAFQTISGISGEKMEAKEARLYASLISQAKTL